MCSGFEMLPVVWNETHGNFLFCWLFLIIQSNVYYWRTIDFLKFLFQGIKNIMPRILLGSNLLKVTVSSCFHFCCLILINHVLENFAEGSNFWGGLKGSVIFALGFHSRMWLLLVIDCRFLGKEAWSMHFIDFSFRWCSIP